MAEGPSAHPTGSVSSSSHAQGLLSESWMLGSGLSAGRVGQKDACPQAWMRKVELTLGTIPVASIGHALGNPSCTVTPSPDMAHWHHCPLGARLRCSAYRKEPCICFADETAQVGPVCVHGDRQPVLGSPRGVFERGQTGARKSVVWTKTW